MIRYVALALRAQIRHSGLLYLLAAGGITLGVAAVLAVQMVNANALASFRGGLRALSGDADLTVLGRTPTFPESLYTRVLAQEGVERAWPLYRIVVALDAPAADTGPRHLEIVGADLFQSAGIPLETAEGDRGRALRVRGWSAVTPELARELGLAVGDTVVATHGTRRIPLVIGGFVDFRRVTPLASRTLTVMDIAQAQALAGDSGALTQIDVRLAADARPASVARGLRRALGPGVDVLTPEQRTERAAGLLGAFRVNLTALSLISLFVGLFLVYASTQASLVRRREEFGVLRALGATRLQLVGLIAVEATLLGAVGVAAGLPVGYLVASANVDVVSATLTNIYLLREIEQLTVPPWLVAGAATIGVAGAVAGAAGPALDTSRRDPHALLAPYTLHERLGGLAGPLAGAGVLLLGGTASWYVAVGREWRPAGFVLAIALLGALVLFTPAVVRRLAELIPVRGFGFGYCVRTLTVRLQSATVAVAALAVAVSMLVGITLMVGSFRRTVEVWVRTTIAADVYVTTPSRTRGLTPAPLDSTVVRQLADLPEVRALDRLRGFLGYVGERRVTVLGVDMGTRLPRDRFPLLSGDPDATWRGVREEGSVLVSEPLARALGLSVGDSVPLSGPQGPVPLPVAGVYVDYSTEGGVVAMDLEALERLFGPGPVNSVALYLASGADPERTVDRVRALGDGVPLLARSNRRLRGEALRIFDQTFAITEVLRGMSLIIAVAGIALTLLVMARERLAELALYRALGAVRPQIFGLFVGQGVAMGLVALILGAVGGTVLAAILVFVVNRSYFGWTIQVAVPWGALAAQAGTILGATLVASLYPAVRAAATPAGELNRDDV